MRRFVDVSRCYAVARGRGSTVGEAVMHDLNELFAALSRSKFRSRFRLGAKEMSYNRVNRASGNR